MSYLIDKHGKVLDRMTSTLDEVVHDARTCALLIQKENALGPEKNKMWEVTKGKLTRTFIQ